MKLLILQSSFFIIFAINSEMVPGAARSMAHIFRMARTLGSWVRIPSINGNMTAIFSYSVDVLCQQRIFTHIILIHSSDD
jgi:hypothetical protein